MGVDVSGCWVCGGVCVCVWVGMRVSVEPVVHAATFNPFAAD